MTHSTSISRVTESVVRSLDVQLGGGRVLRIGLHAPHGGSAELFLAAGFPDRHGWPRLLSEAVCVSADALPELRDALTTLAAVNGREELDA